MPHLSPSKLLLPVLLLLSGALRAEGSPSPQLAAFNHGRELFAAHDYTGVVTLLAPFAGAKPEPPLRTLLAAAYLELGREAEAAAVLAPVAATAEAGAPLLFQAARAAAALGDEAKANTYLRRAAAADPTSAAARALGFQVGSAGNMEEACGLLRPYLAAHPEDREVRVAATYCALELGQPDAAEKLLRPLPAELAEAHVLGARLALLRGQPYQAIAALEPLAAAPPAQVAREVRRNLGEAWLEVGKADAASALLDGHVDGDLELGLLLARAHEQAGDPAGVIATVTPFASRIQADPLAADAPRSVLAKLALTWGRALLAGQRWAEAVTVLEAATRLAPDDAPAWQALVQALRGAGRPDDAAAALARLRAATASRP